MYTATGGLEDTSDQAARLNDWIMEYELIQNLKAVSGDKSMCRQRHHKFVAALGQVMGEYEVIMCKLVREIGLGEELDNMMRRSREIMEMC